MALEINTFYNLTQPSTETHNTKQHDEHEIIERQLKEQSTGRVPQIETGASYKPTWIDSLNSASNIIRNTFVCKSIIGIPITEIRNECIL